MYKPEGKLAITDLIKKGQIATIYCNPVNAYRIADDINDVPDIRRPTVDIIDYPVIRAGGMVIVFKDADDTILGQTMATIGRHYYHRLVEIREDEIYRKVKDHGTESC